MAVIDLAPSSEPKTNPAAAHRPKAVLCGSYRRDLVGLSAAYEALSSAGCNVLSPVSLDFVDEVDGFVITEDERGQAAATIEGRHLNALRAADFVWLHCPAGYVGASAALEIGVAHSLDVPVFASEAPEDGTVAGFVRVVDGPSTPVVEARGNIRTPATPLRDLQSYYGRMALDRGFERESAQDAMLLLTEEVGELARAIRKGVGIARADATRIDTGAELADVVLYLLHLANIVGVDLADAVREKERRNQARYGRAA